MSDARLSHIYVQLRELANAMQALRVVDVLLGEIPGLTVMQVQELMDAMTCCSQSNRALTRGIIYKHFSALGRAVSLKFPELCDTVLTAQSPDWSFNTRVGLADAEKDRLILDLDESVRTSKERYNSAMSDIVSKYREHYGQHELALLSCETILNAFTVVYDPDWIADKEP